MNSNAPQLKLHRGAAGAAGVSAAAAQLLRTFVQQLNGLHAALQELSELAAQKLDAIRRADAGQLQDVAAREGPLLSAVFRGDQERKATLAQLAQHLQCATSERVCLSEIANRVDEPLRSALRARSAALQQTTLDLQKKNRLAADVARRLQCHLRGIFADVAGAGRETRGYGPHGRQEHSQVRCWVDAVG